MDDHEAGSQPNGPGLLTRAIKRTFDIAVAVVILTVTSPLLLLASLLVKLTSPGPVFYRAHRAGYRGASFHMLKFRTMRTGSDSKDRMVTAARDDRITPIGNLLRKTKVDELPQLWNVLRGEMSIVGPRPEDWGIVQEHYRPEHRRALLTRPGIVCTPEILWYPDLTYHDPPPPGVAIQQHYIERHMPAQALEGARYAEQQSLWLDFKIMALTAFNVLVRSWWPPKPKPLPPGGYRVASSSVAADGSRQRR
jgi:lipopolysaccharide/colanic/teichoic acid biosynthesis glycosyltransferase